MRIKKRYGSQIIKNGTLDICLKTKNRIVTRTQYRILDFFGGLKNGSPTGHFFARITRRLVGGYIYSIKLEINERCDLDCKMCYVPKNETELDYATITRFLDRIKPFRIRLEILGGEPLLHPDIFKIVAHARTKSRIPYITLYTNGIHASKEKARLLQEAGLDAPIVSLVSYKSEVHDEFTGKSGSWNRTIEGIRNLSDAGMKVYTFTPVHNCNFKDIERIYTFVKQELKVSALFYPYIPQAKDDPLMIDPETWQTIKHWILAEKNRKHREFIGNFFMLTGNACSGGNFVLTVKADGSVQPCPFISDLPLGNIHEDDIWSIYKHRFRFDHMRSFKSVPEKCRPCTYSSVCGGGCKAGSKKLYGTYDHMDHNCLGPYSKDINKDDITDCVPSFF